MSSDAAPRAKPKVTVPSLRQAKRDGRRITALTAYDVASARVVDEAGIDLVLVGDTYASVVLGHETTLPVSMDEMLVAVRAVARGLDRALLVADMPFGSYQSGDDRAVENAVRFLQAGAEAVKLEGGTAHADLVRRLVESGIPVLGHVGLTPQSVHAMGGYKVQGKDPDNAQRVFDDADALAQAGVFGVVLEGIPAGLSARITDHLEAVTIGIGAGPSCDGQILVYHDLLGYGTGRQPKFVRKYLDLHRLAVGAVRTYCDDVHAGGFPSERESYGTGSSGAASPRPTADAPVPRPEVETSR